MGTLLLGIGSPFKSKKGFDCQTVGVASDYSQREIKNGCVGKKVEVLFLPDSCIGKVETGWVGKEVRLDYEISGGKAYLQGIALVK